jgi:hypothetical protein
MTDPAVYVAVYLAPWSAGGWPFDIGDDPSFESSAQHTSSGGRLGWGVCRTDLRNRVVPGDLVVFIAAERAQKEEERQYRLAGWATVAEKVSQVEVWEQPRLEPYRRYRNLLIAPGPNPADYLHHELDAPWHQDCSGGWVKPRGRLRRSHSGWLRGARAAFATA